MARRVMRGVRHATMWSWCIAVGTVLLTVGGLLVPRAVQSETELCEVELVDTPAPAMVQIFEGRDEVMEPVQVKLHTHHQEAGQDAPVDIRF